MADVTALQADFTFVCPSEIVAFSDRIDEFREIDAEVVSLFTFVRHQVCARTTLLTPAKPRWWAQAWTMCTATWRGSSRWGPLALLCNIVGDAHDAIWL
jgi:hypothetical protein